MAITEEQLTALEQAHGKIKHVEYNGHDIVFRKPKRVEVTEHATKLERGGPEKIGADEHLAKQIVVHCDGEEGTAARFALVALIEEFPYLARNEKIGMAIGKLVGVVEDLDAKTYGTNLTGKGSSPTTTQGG